jgi:hypothetical protein
MPPQEVPPVPQSKYFKGIRFAGKQRNYLDTIKADIWYPSWAADGSLYTSWADGNVKDSSAHSVNVNCQWLLPEDKQERCSAISD